MTVIELPDDLAAALKAKAAAQDLKLKTGSGTLADAPANVGNDLDRIFAEIRGLADDVDFSRDTAASRPVDL